MWNANRVHFVEVMFSCTQFLHMFHCFFGGLFLFLPDSFTPFGFAPRVSHIIWLTLPSIAHHLACMVHGLCVTG